VLCTYLYTSDLIPVNPMPLVGRPKITKTLPKVLPADSAQKLLAAINSETERRAAIGRSIRRPASRRSTRAKISNHSADYLGPATAHDGRLRLSTGLGVGVDAVMGVASRDRLSQDGSAVDVDDLTVDPFAVL